MNKIAWVGFRTDNLPFALRLEMDGFPVEKITDIEAGLAGIAQQNYSLVIVSEIFPVRHMKLPKDISDPVDAALYVIGEIRELQNEKPILVPYLGEKFDIVRYRRAGADHFYYMFNEKKTLVDLVKEIINPLLP